MDEDRLIIGAVLAGEKEKYGLLVQKYQNPVMNTVYKIVGNYEDSKDLTQEVFIKTYMSLIQYKKEYKFYSWLYRIAINEAFMHLKKARTMVGIRNLKHDFILEEEFAEQESKRTLVRRSIGELPEKYKVVITLKYFAGISYQEISSSIGISEKKVKSRLFEGRRQLMGILLKRGLLAD